nr:sigma-70 family RNA polymerase sigma factor [Propionicimonas sp.]
MHRPSPTPLLTAAEERLLARDIEAGVIARHLLDTGAPPVAATTEELEEIATTGEQAWQRFLLANLRLVWKLAGREARRSGLPTDELFQEGFVALAGALQRYDPERGRFSTFATIRVCQHLAEVGAARFGELALPPSRALQLRRARALAAALGQERGGTVVATDLAQEFGRPPTCTSRLLGYRRPIGLDGATDGTGIPEAVPRDFDAAIYGEQVRRVLGRLDADQARVLALRYGFATGGPVEVTEVATRLTLSPSTVRRLERRALAALRPLVASLDPCAEEPLAG